MPEFVSLESIDDVHMDLAMDPIERYFDDMDLTPHERAVILFRLEQRTLAEIARLFNKSIKWVRIRIESVQQKYTKTYGKHK